MTVFLDVILAFSERVPELDCPVTRTRDNLPVVCAEGDRQDIGSVANELTGGETSDKVPKAECVIPGRGEGKLAVGGDDDVRDEVVVPVEDTLGVAVLVLVPGQCPDDDRFVCARGESVRPRHE